MSDYSSQDKQKLAKEFRDMLAEKKAQELGVSKDEMIASYANGQLSFIKKQEAYEKLEKQRNMAGDKKVVRSLRDGEDSLLSRLGEEINRVINLVNELSRKQILVAMERVDIMGALNKSQKRSLDLKENLENIERHIERTKEGDSIFLDAEEVLKQIQQAKNNQDYDTMNQLMSEHRELIRKYETRRKSLEPQLQTARHSRVDLQREYWRVYNLRWKLQDKHIQSLMQTMDEIVNNTNFQTTCPKAFHLLQDIQSTCSELQQKERQLGAKVPEKKDETSDQAMERWNQLLDTTGQLIEQQQKQRKLLVEMVEKYSPMLKKDEDGHRRMAYAERQKNK